MFQTTNQQWMEVSIARKITNFYGPFFPACHVALPEGPTPIAIIGLHYWACHLGCLPWGLPWTMTMEFHKYKFYQILGYCASTLVYKIHIAVENTWKTPFGTWSNCEFTVGYPWESDEEFYQIHNHLVGGLNPSEKYWSIGMSIPNIWEKKKCSKPPTR